MPGTEKHSPFRIRIAHAYPPFPSCAHGSVTLTFGVVHDCVTCCGCDFSVLVVIEIVTLKNKTNVQLI
jgi:hypothetical protein